MRMLVCKRAIAGGLFGGFAGLVLCASAAANDVVFQPNLVLPNIGDAATGDPVCADAGGRLVTNCAASSQLTHFDQFEGMACTSKYNTPGTIEIAHGTGDAIGFNCVPDVPPTLVCDETLGLSDTDPLHAAQAIELCETTTSGSGSGVISANYVRANGAPFPPGLQTGITPMFGTNVAPRGGDRMLVLSTGRARDAGDPDFCGSDSCNNAWSGPAPAGFPLAVPSCPTPGGTVHDAVGLELTLRAPDYATGFAFDFKFYTFDYPTWVCSTYNDQAIVLMNPPPAGAINGDISFDNSAGPIGVNSNFLDVCSGCPQGTSELAGTGFDANAATSWLTTTAPISGGDEFTLRFAIWDSGDAGADSTMLIDNFRWLSSGASTLGTAVSTP